MSFYSNITNEKVGACDLNCGLRIQGYRDNPYAAGTGITYNSSAGLPLNISANNSNLYANFTDYNGDKVAQKAGLQSDYAVLGTAFIIPSDKRIKSDIEEVPDNLSLQKLRDISCCYYGYIDKVNRGFEKTIGFIAQQVKEHFPIAVSTHVDFIPNELRSIDNPQWVQSEDISTNYVLTIPDLRDVSDNTLFKFYVTDDLSGTEIEVKSKKLQIISLYLNIIGSMFSYMEKK